MKQHWKYRVWIDKSATFFIFLFCILAVIPFISLLWVLIKNGFEQLNIDLFTHTSPTVIDAMLAQLSGELIPGGIANGILGGFYMILIAAVIAVPIGICTGLYLYETRNKFASLVQSASYILQGLPSILIGLIAYIWVVRNFYSFSALAGGVALSIILLPHIIHATVGTLKMLPNNLKENGLALGGSNVEILLKIILPSASGGLLGRILYAVSQAIGETAPLLITALGASMINWDLLKPTSSISLLIWEFFNNPNMINLMWSAALILFVLVITLNIVSKQIFDKWKKTMFL
jgi:phosphate transport system permease protein